MGKRADLAVQTQLKAITQSRKMLASMDLADAELTLRQASDVLDRSLDKVASTYAAWTHCIRSTLLGPQSVQVTGHQLLAAESDLTGSRKRHDAATREAGQKRSELISIEARLRAEQDGLMRARRQLAAKAEERRYDEAADRATNRWFRAQ